MKTIYKYGLHITDRQVISMPRGAKLLTVQVQDENICLWAIVDTAQKTVDHIIHMVGTGHPMRDILRDSYIATVQDPPFVWHVFDGGESL